MAHRGPLSRKSPRTPPTVETALTYPMRRRIPTADVAVARTAPTLHRLRLGSRSASAIRPHAAARRTALTCDHDARTRDPDTRATRPWILLSGRAGCAARAHRPGGARRAIDARPRPPTAPRGNEAKTHDRIERLRHTTPDVADSDSGRAAVPTCRTAVSLGTAPGRTATA